MSLNRDRGKQYEKFIAKDNGGRRIGTMGKEDVLLPPDLSCECKEREKLPKFLKKTMQQAIDNCPDHGRPVVFLHELNSLHTLDVVIMPYAVFKELYKAYKDKYR